MGKPSGKWSQVGEVDFSKERQRRKSQGVSETCKFENNLDALLNETRGKTQKGKKLKTKSGNERRRLNCSEESPNQAKCPGWIQKFQDKAVLSKKTEHPSSLTLRLPSNSGQSFKLQKNFKVDKADWWLSGFLWKFKGTFGLNSIRPIPTRVVFLFPFFFSLFQLLVSVEAQCTVSSYEPVSRHVFPGRKPILFATTSTYYMVTHGSKPL